MKPCYVRKCCAFCRKVLELERDTDAVFFHILSTNTVSYVNTPIGTPGWQATTLNDYAVTFQYCPLHLEKFFVCLSSLSRWFAIELFNYKFWISLSTWKCRIPKTNLRSFLNLKFMWKILQRFNHPIRQRSWISAALPSSKVEISTAKNKRRI